MDITIQLSLLKTFSVATYIIYIVFFCCTVRHTFLCGNPATFATKLLQRLSYSYRMLIEDVIKVEYSFILKKPDKWNQGLQLQGKILGGLLVFFASVALRALPSEGSRPWAV